MLPLLFFLVLSLLLLLLLLLISLAVAVAVAPVLLLSPRLLPCVTLRSGKHTHSKQAQNDSMLRVHKLTAFLHFPSLITSKTTSKLSDLAAGCDVRVSCAQEKIGRQAICTMRAVLAHSKTVINLAGAARALSSVSAI